MPYFTISKSFLVPSFDISLKEHQKLDAFLEILEESEVAQYIHNEEEAATKAELGGRPPYNPYRLFATIAYAFSKHSGSVRKIEESINYDLRFIYLMEQERPTHVTISKFLNNVVVKAQHEIFTSIVKAIVKKYDICIDDVFIDGSKFEANANKYKLVWKPLTFHKKLNENIKTLIAKHFPGEVPASRKFVSKDLALYLNRFLEKADLQHLNPHTLPRGRGHHNPEIIKDYFLLEKFLYKLLEYEEKFAICGPDRNSFFKTDKDATAMTLKEDYYSGLGSNTRAAYNTQIAVAKGIILDYYVCQDRNDYYTFIPFLEAFSKHYHFFPKRVCADAGYGTTDNYQFLGDNLIGNFVKFPDWQQETEGRKITLFTINSDRSLACLNNKNALPMTTLDNRNVRRRQNSFYKIEDCLYCRHKKVCTYNLKHPIKDHRVFETNPQLFHFKNEARANLLSPKGIEMRINRSSQVEGAYGVIKQDLQFTRFRRRSLENVSAEFMLVCLGYVLRKLFTLIDGTAKLDYWIAPADLQPQVMPPMNFKKATKKRYVGENEKLRTNRKKRR
jgi:transposase